jgi:hypothetical protein
VANDLFRMVSLRRSKTSPREGAPTSAPDPRLQYRPILEEQTTIVASPRETKLQELKDRHAELSNKMVQLETVHRAVVNVYMSERQEESAPSARPTRRSIELRDAHAGSTIIGDPSHFSKDVKKHLNDADAALFQDLISTSPGEPLNDFATIGTLLDLGGFINEANGFCRQIEAIEENLSEELPTVTGQPSTQPIVAAVGWGDLIVARESLVGYDAREIAHIENILPGETKLREHRRLSKTEEVTEIETITEKESEKDSQTTDRYELQAESQEAINRNFSISTGVNTSGRYGVTKVDTSLDAAFSQSESQSRSSSINTGREIVTKAVERTFERVRRLRRLTITEEIRELNRHKLTNTAGTDTPKAISGMYLWVEKI